MVKKKISKKCYGENKIRKKYYGLGINIFEKGKV